jgi:hypothetical protein
MLFMCTKESRVPSQYFANTLVRASVQMPRSQAYVATGPNCQHACSIYALSISTQRQPRNPQLPTCFTRRGSPRRPPAASPPRGAPIPRRTAPCLVPCRIEVLPRCYQHRRSQADGGASCDAAPLVSCRCHCRTNELHAPPLTSVLASSSATMSLHSIKL